MLAKKINSTHVQTHFGRILDEINRSRTCYIIMRRETPQAVMLSLESLIDLLSHPEEGRRMRHLLERVRPAPLPGQPVEGSESHL